MYSTTPQAAYALCACVGASPATHEGMDGDCIFSPAAHESWDELARPATAAAAAAAFVRVYYQLAWMSLVRMCAAPGGRGGLVSYLHLTLELVCLVRSKGRRPASGLVATRPRLRLVSASGSATVVGSQWHGPCGKAKAPCAKGSLRGRHRDKGAPGRVAVDARTQYRCARRGRRGAMVKAPRHDKILPRERTWMHVS